MSPLKQAWTSLSTIKKILIVVVTVGVIGVIGSNGNANSDTTTAPQDTTNYYVPQETYAPDTTVPNREDIFWSVVQDEMGNRYSRQAVLDVAKSACKTLRNGGTFADIMGALAATSNDSQFLNDAGFVIGAGVAAFCPEYMDDLQNYIASF